MKRSISIGHLKQAAKELNSVMGLEPPIKTDDVDKEDLIENLREASMLLVPDDELTQATTNILENLPNAPT